MKRLSSISKTLGDQEARTRLKILHTSASAETTTPLHGDQALQTVGRKKKLFIASELITIHLSPRGLLLIGATTLNAADEFGSGDVRSAWHGLANAHFTRHLVVWIIVRIREAVLVLLAERYHMNAVLPDELLRQAKAGRVGDDLCHTLAACHL